MKRRSWVESPGSYISRLACIAWDGDHYYGAILAAHISEHALRDSGSLALLGIGHFFLFQDVSCYSPFEPLVLRKATTAA